MQNQSVFQIVNIPVPSGAFLSVRLLPPRLRSGIPEAQHGDVVKLFRVACEAVHRFMHLPDQALQIAALKNLREQLLPGGILTLNTFDPWPPIQAVQMQTSPDDYSFRLEYVNRDGNREKIYNAISYNPYTQQMSGNWKFVEYNDQDEIIGERIRPLLMRQTTRWEMFLLAQLCGFEVLDIYRGYKGDKEDLKDPSSASRYQSNLIWILKRKER